MTSTVDAGEDGGDPDEGNGRRCSRHVCQPPELLTLLATGSAEPQDESDHGGDAGDDHAEGAGRQHAVGDTTETLDAGRVRDVDALEVESAERTGDHDVAEDEEAHTRDCHPSHQPPPPGRRAPVGEQQEHERDRRDRQERDPASQPGHDGGPRERPGRGEEGVHDVGLAEAHQHDAERDRREQPADRVPWVARGDQRPHGREPGHPDQDRGAEPVSRFLAAAQNRERDGEDQQSHRQEPPGPGQPHGGSFLHSDDS